MYFDDPELAIRYKTHGFCSKIINGPKIIHFERASDSAGGKSFRFQMMYFEKVYLNILKSFILEISLNTY